MFRRLFDRLRRQKEIDEELDYHLWMTAKEHMEEDADSSAASLRARRTLGNKTQIQEATRAVWIPLWIDSLRQDLSYAARTLRRTPVFTAVAILSLAIGIGANTAMFSILYAWFIHPLPFPNPDRLALVILGWHDKAQASEESPGIFPFYRHLEAWKKGNHTLESLGGAFWRNFILTGKDEAQEVAGTVTDADFFQVLGVAPELGRTFRPEDRQSEPVVVISHQLWRSQLGGSADVIGKYVTLNAVPHRIVGVMPEKFDFRLLEQRTGSRLWKLAQPSDSGYGPNGDGNMAGIARLKRGISLKAAQDDLDAIEKLIDRQFPDTPKGFDAALKSLNLNNTLLIRTTLFTLAAAIFTMLLIACFNIAGLQTGRSIERQSELALRAAIGAGRGRLLRQLFTENALLGGIGTTLGIAFAYLFVSLFLAYNPLQTLPAVPVRVNGAALTVSVMLGLLVTFASGITPTLTAVRMDTIGALRTGGSNHSGTRKTTHIRELLVTIEVAATVVLLVGTALLVHTLIQLRSAPLGYDARSVSVARMVFPGIEKMSEVRFRDGLNGLLAQIRRLPGVESAAISDVSPLGNGFLNGDFRLKTSGRGETRELKTELRTVSPGYFEALSIPLIEGRRFTDLDSKISMPVAIVNELFTRRWSHGDEMVGKAVFVEDKWRTIIGVARSTKVMAYSSITWQSVPQIYLPERQSPEFAANPVGRSVELLVRSKVAMDRRTVQRVLTAAAPEAAVAEWQPLTALTEAATNQPNLRSLLLGFFSAVALSLATIGIFGTLTQFVKQGQREMSIRGALGATPGDLLRSVLLRGVALTAAGALCGGLVLLAGSRLLGNLLYGIPAFDPFALAGATLLLMAVATVASFIPARRAATLDPIASLRKE
jgi:putative ABC transport system permease protein